MIFRNKGHHTKIQAYKIAITKIFDAIVIIFSFGIFDGEMTSHVYTNLIRDRLKK